MIDNEEKKLVVIISVLAILVGVLSYWLIGFAMKPLDNMKKAIRLSDNEQFSYAIKTQYTGGIWGTGRYVLNPVGHAQLINTYGKIRIVTEEYRMHTYVTCSKVGKTEVCTTHYYYSWDYDSEKIIVDKELNFMGASFPTSQVSVAYEEILPLSEKTVFIQYIQKVSNNYLYDKDVFWNHEHDLRYRFYITPYQGDGILYIRSTQNGFMNEYDKTCGCIIGTDNPDNIISTTERKFTFIRNFFLFFFPILIIGGFIWYFYQNDNF